MRSFFLPSILSWSAGCDIRPSLLRPRPPRHLARGQQPAPQGSRRVEPPARGRACGWDGQEGAPAEEGLGAGRVGGWTCVLSARAWGGRGVLMIWSAGLLGVERRAVQRNSWRVGSKPVSATDGQTNGRTTVGRGVGCCAPGFGRTDPLSHDPSLQAPSPPLPLPSPPCPPSRSPAPCSATPSSCRPTSPRTARTTRSAAGWRRRPSSRPQSTRRTPRFVPPPSLPALLSSRISTREHAELTRYGGIT